MPDSLQITSDANAVIISDTTSLLTAEPEVKEQTVNAQKAVDQVPAPSISDTTSLLTAEHETQDQLATTQNVVAQAPAPWKSGIEGDSRTMHPGHDSGMLTIIVVVALLITFGMRHTKSMLATLVNEMVSTRQRDNLFEERTTNENTILLLLALLVSMNMGLLLSGYIATVVPIPSHAVLLFSIECIGLYALLYALRFAAYRFVAFTFTTPDNSRIWLQGFTATQSLLGLCLLPPMFVYIFFPGLAVYTFYTAAILYIFFEIVFIYKGFRIFYHNFPSLLYFILYLCSLEIIPLITVYKLAMAFAEFMR